MYMLSDAHHHGNTIFLSDAYNHGNTIFLYDAYNHGSTIFSSDTYNHGNTIFLSDIYNHGNTIFSSNTYNHGNTIFFLLLPDIVLYQSINELITKWLSRNSISLFFSSYQVCHERYINPLWFYSEQYSDIRKFKLFSELVSVTLIFDIFEGSVVENHGHLI